MMLKTTTLDMGGVYRDDFVKYFLHIGGKTEDQQKFKGSFWEVIVGPDAWKRLGSLRMNHVLVTLSAEEEKYDEFLAEFHLNFLKAGG